MHVAEAKSDQGIDKASGQLVSEGRGRFVWAHTQGG